MAQPSGVSIEELISELIVMTCLAPEAGSVEKFMSARPDVAQPTIGARPLSHFVC
jgi:hypothetical protein